jgi:enamine deaminase RidA (YjgF/YER057c/UK114 family)
MQHIMAPALARFEDDWHFSHAVRHHGLLYLSGVTGTNEEGFVPSDATEQFERAFLHLRLYLEAANATFRDIIEMTTYHVSLHDHLDAFTTVKDRHITKPYPAWSAIGVSDLITRGALVEIRVIAQAPA